MLPLLPHDPCEMRCSCASRMLPLIVATQGALLERQVISINLRSSHSGFMGHLLWCELVEYYQKHLRRFIAN
jgi:hypothetical protein